MNIPTLASKTILIGVNISRFSGQKKDKKATDEVTKDNKAKDGNVRVWKSLLKGQALSEVVNAEQKIRQALYKQTSRWDDVRICKIENFVKVKLELEKHIHEFYEAAQKVIDSYDTLIQEDKIKLGDMYNPADYPSKASFAASFSVKIITKAVEKNDFRSNILSQEDIDEINKQIEERINAFAAEAQKDILERVNERLMHLMQRLADSDGRFHESNLDNVTEVITQARDLNITENPKFDALFDKIEKSINSLSPDQIRNSKSQRSKAIVETTQCVEEVSKAMSEFLV
jgi:hypothetical protein